MVEEHKKTDLSEINNRSEVMEQEEAVDESAAIRRWMEKKHIDLETISKEQLWKFYQFLLRKGFHYEDIQHELKL